MQNGADAILEGHEDELAATHGNRIQVLVRDSCLYVANTGAPLDADGVDALLSSHRSPKRGNQIGRFGLGFKSLLRFGSSIDLFTKKSGAMRFEPVRCRQELKDRFNVVEAPGLRLAWPLEESEWRGDGHLDELTWAETIVRVEVPGEEMRAHLLAEIRDFPAEFLLFFPLPTTLTLDDGETPPRKLRVDTDGDEKVLRDGGGSSCWRVTAREVSITDPAALGDATHIHARETVPLAWAMPLEGKREEAGRFWAFFPTHTPTYLPGILNAPWKLNSDRNAIIGGEWNSSLMLHAASLVASAIGSLSAEDDPARTLDAFPRQLERKDEDAVPFIEALWSELAKAKVIPNGTGQLSLARDLNRHPRDNIELARSWEEVVGTDDQNRFVHSSCLERQRVSRLNALAERLVSEEDEASSEPRLQRSNATAWFAAVASTKTEKAVQALELAEAFANDCRPGEWNGIRPVLEIIPAQSGKLVAAGRVVFAPVGVSVPGRAVVAADVSGEPEPRRILANVMKVKELDDSVWSEVLRESLNVRGYPPEACDADWTAFWQRLRSAPKSIRQQFANHYSSQIHVRRCDEEWVSSDQVLLPGALIDADDTSDNKNFLVDPEMHGDDVELLSALGISEFPEGTDGPGKYDDVVGQGSALQRWLREVLPVYRDALEANQNPQEWYLKPLRIILPRGWQLLSNLSAAANARLTQRFLDRIEEGEFQTPLKFGHITRRDVYPIIDVSNPLGWLLLRHGSLQIGEKIVPLVSAVSRCHEEAPTRLSGWAQLSPVLEYLDGIDTKVQPALADIQAFWIALIEMLATPTTIADDSLEALWTSAVRDGVVPDILPSEAGDVPLSDIYVTGSPDLARRVRSPERIVVTLDETALELWLDNGARNLADLVQPEWSDLASPADLLTSVLPDLAEDLKPDLVETARCQPVSGLALKVDTQSTPVPCLMWDNTLLLDTEQLSLLSRVERFRLLLGEVAAAGWLDCSPEVALQQLGDARVDELRAAVAGESTLSGRLLRAVGRRREPLQEALGGIGDMDFVEQCTPLELAELTLAQLGPATLTTLKEVLEQEGLKPPSRWNTVQARTFVAAIGFPEEFAASPATRREAEEFISGPIDLPPLHDFQEEVFDGVHALLASGTTRRRAVVSLPTGGGKTRVTVESAVRLVLAPESDHRSVVWVAQTDELCEQAVQAFRQVWVNLGARSTDLRIVRLWGGNPNPAIQDPDRPVAVVASIQTLNSRMGAEGLAWLQKPGLVVVDECHHAITRSYTNLLRWLDAEAPRTGTPEKDEPPMLGLSATPFRTDDEESQRLAKRFDGRWFPPDQVRLHARLLAQGVLAHADYDALDSGAGLSDEEMARLSDLPDVWEGLDFENLLEAINQRLAGDKHRNQRLMEFVQQCDALSILFFTNSVKHAEEMSARLNLAGITAAAVSGSTPPVARRYFLDRFQSGDIRVLCNHSVLTTGFDAPKTDMVLVARQVFSPVRYMQMVGRGLRGEKNGGTPRCRIVTVIDNLGRFQDRHPYHYCKRYFSDDRVFAEAL
ncbi:MAG: DEAD/DEAH box helicase [Candidatus Thiodiazotropha sp. (ex Ctena orbiculata)]|uniref:DEAD/DEAH box helicase n=1 Tax=Candidatus Thiodiazotropha taylori TaxID=2792791 RepID=A0A944MFB3_9GAMM|nr:DEAD/DEAH box helicase [Candidatus Thiodiazotropha taylori]